jgi:hypothetical protein
LLILQPQSQLSSVQPSWQRWMTTSFRSTDHGTKPENANGQPNERHG